MADINEKMLFHYLHNKVYAQDDQNAIGATTSTTLRTVTAHTDLNSIYVRKFGTDYEITEVTDIEDPIDPNMEFCVYALDGTLLGSRGGGGAFVAGSTVTAQGCYLEIEADGGAVTVLAGIDITTDVDVGGKTFVCAAETIADGDVIRLYLSDTTSTYYDENYMYGGARHIPDSTSLLPYFDITTAIADPDVTGFTICTVLDSAIYDEQFSISIAGMILQAALGQTPTITSGVGARVTREVEHDGNNTDTRYVDKTGSDANAGTYQEPYLTIQFAENNMGGLAYINIMDSNDYNEPVTVNIAISIEPLYGMTPRIIANGLSLSHLNANAYGITIDGQNLSGGILVNGITYQGEIKNNTTYNCSRGIELRNAPFPAPGIIERNHVYNCSIEGIKIHTQLGDCSGSVIFNKIHNCTDGILFLSNIQQFLAPINNNIIYLNEQIGLSFDTAFAGSSYIGVCENNTITLNGEGIRYEMPVFAGGTFRNMIAYNNTTFDLNKTGVGVPTITESNYGTNSGWTIGAGNIVTDPEFCKITASYKFGISANSGAYRTDTSDDDMGAHLRIIEYNASTVEVNGFIIDGQGFYNNGAYIADDVNHVGCSLKWCSVFDFQGISVDPYDDDTDTDFTISNCKIYNNGNGIKLSYGGNAIAENLIHNNTIFSIWSDRTNQTFNHNSIHGSQYGLYLESNSSGIIIKNSIFQGNSLFGIYSEVNIAITYCCIPDAVNNVDITDVSNTTDDPLFVDVISTIKDFHIKTTEGGYIHESPCKDSADDDKDIGAYDVLRSVESESRKKYQLESNPFKMDPITKIKGNINIDNAIGDLKRFALAKKRIFPLNYAADDYQTEAQIETLRFLSTLIPGIGGLIESECEILLHLLPDQKLFEGTAGTIDATAKTIDDAAQTWTRDQYRGFWTAVKFTSGVSLVIDATLKTGTKAAAGWTIDEWIGYYFYHNYNYYYILSNTASVLTLSDTDGTLEDETAATYAIEKYFKILQNTKNEILLSDSDDELVTGSYDYYIDFIVVQSTNKNFQPKQDSGFRYQRHWQKTGFTNTFEEK